MGDHPNTLIETVQPIETKPGQSELTPSLLRSLNTEFFLIATHGKI